MKKYQHYNDARGEVLSIPHKKRQLLRPLNNLEKTDPSEIENLLYEKTADSVLLSLFMSLSLNGDTDLKGTAFLMITMFYMIDLNKP